MSLTYSTALGGSQNVQEHSTPGFLQGGAEQLDGNLTGGKNSFGTTVCAAPCAVVLTVSGLTETTPKSTTNTVGAHNLNSEV